MEYEIPAQIFFMIKSERVKSASFLYGIAKGRQILLLVKELL